MKCLRLKIDIKKDTDIKEACSDVKELAEFLNEDLSFNFNGVYITTTLNSINDMINGYLKQR